ncbi:exopolysaccharide Pel transporter PelG (plasmid) [Cereibacter azotoformans]|uniref:exopolysaccharide Pel transporter PelG n=1 Tax=Cereibacter azotoformans TaxID=43057 RepID=UPI003B2190E1
MSRTDPARSVLPPLRRAAAATVIAAGPWLVAVAALALISRTMEPLMGVAAVEDLRLGVVYAVCCASLAAGPIGTIAAGLIRTGIDDGQAMPVTGIFLAAGLLAALCALGLGTAIALLLGIHPIGNLLGLLLLTGAICFLWTSFSVLSALRAHRFLIGAFTLGMTVSVACCILAARHAPTTPDLIWAFSAGVLLCVALALRHVRLRFGLGDRLTPALGLLLGALARQRLLAGGILLGVAAVWIDKWVFWAAPVGASSQAGHRHFADYDAVMFLAHLAVIPAVAAMHMLQEGPIRQALRSVQRDILGGAARMTIRRSVDALVATVRQGILAILFVQATLTLAFMLAAPLLTEAAQLGFNQFLMLRVGLFSTLLYSIVYVCSSILIICDRKAAFLQLQGGLLLLNLLFSILFYLEMGVTAYAFLFANLLVSAMAIILAVDILPQYDFVMFSRAISRRRGWSDSRSAPP